MTDRDPAAVELAAIRALTRLALVAILVAAGLAGGALAMRVDPTVALGAGGLAGILLTLAANAVGSLGTRRTRIDPPAAPAEPTTPWPPPPTPEQTAAMFPTSPGEAP